MRAVQNITTGLSQMEEYTKNHSNNHLNIESKVSEVWGTAPPDKKAIQ